jgi:hypothetical protein
MFEIEFGDCDEGLHPHCEGVECETVLLVTGFGSLEQAEEYAREILYDRHTVAEILAEPGDGLLADVDDDRGAGSRRSGRPGLQRG